MLTLFLLLIINFPNLEMKPSDENTLNVEISLSKEEFKQNQSIKIKTTVTNTSDKAARFCDYHTPFEGIANEIFLVQKDGKKIPYQGILKKRIPPTKEDYIKLQAGKNTSCVVILNNDYDLSEPGEYTVQFKGSLISGLPDSNELSFVVK